MNKITKFFLITILSLGAVQSGKVYAVQSSQAAKQKKAPVQSGNAYIAMCGDSDEWRLDAPNDEAAKTRARNECGASGVDWLYTDNDQAIYLIKR
jgi:hypothetical protein